MKSKTLKNILVVLALVALSAFEIPEGWTKGGDCPDKYDMGMDKGSGKDGKIAATIKSNSQKIKGFGTLMQSCLAEKFARRRVRMSGYVKSQNVKGWAGLWLRIDTENRQKLLGFDNMQDRPIKNTTEWKKYDIVLDVPSNAYSLAYGALLSGEGQIWFSDIAIEIVSDTTTPTKKYCNVCSPILNQPTNLNFEK